jgi:methylglyoxal synthase
VALNDNDTEAGRRQRIALVAHDGRKQDMREWAEFTADFLISSPLMSSPAVGDRPGI